MPTISMFYGIIIRMYNNGEHNPPHFHAQYQGRVAVFDMDGNITEGEMPLNSASRSLPGLKSIKMNCLRTGNWL